MEFVDTHCHLTLDTYDEDLAEVIDRASLNGISHIIVPGLDLASSRQAVELSVRFRGVYAAVGVHPEEAAGFTENELRSFEDLLTCEKVVAIGEIGLDYYHRQDQIELQKDVLKVFLSFAVKHKKPVILHSRESLDDLFGIIENEFTLSHRCVFRGVFHAFEGALPDAIKAAGMGLSVGAGGPVTYKNAHKKHAVFSKIGLNHIVLETDGPFLSPQAFRGKRNEPSFVPVIAEKIAELQHCDIKEVASTTTSNANSLFNWI